MENQLPEIPAQDSNLIRTMSGNVFERLYDTPTKASLGWRTIKYQKPRAPSPLPALSRHHLNIPPGDPISSSLASPTAASRGWQTEKYYSDGDNSYQAKMKKRRSKSAPPRQRRPRPKPTAKQNYSTPQKKIEKSAPPKAASTKKAPAVAVATTRSARAPATKKQKPPSKPPSPPTQVEPKKSSLPEKNGSSTPPKVPSPVTVPVPPMTRKDEENGSSTPPKAPSPETIPVPPVTGKKEGENSSTPPKAPSPETVDVAQTIPETQNDDKKIEESPASEERSVPAEVVSPSLSALQAPSSSVSEPSSPSDETEDERAPSPSPPTPSPPPPPPPPPSSKKKKKKKKTKKFYIDEEECLESMEIFGSIDENGDGILSLDEIDLAVTSIWPSFDNKPAVMSSYTATDVTDRGFIQEDEFMFFMQYLSYYNNLYDAFEELEDEENRSLSKEEFVRGCANIDILEEEGESNPETLFDAIDVNNGQSIKFDEFCTYMADKKYPAPAGAKPQKKESVIVEADGSNADGDVALKTKEEDDEPSLSCLDSEEEEDTGSEKGMAVKQKFHVPPEEECMKIFSDIDMNGNGLLSLAELDKAVLATWPEFNNKPAIMRAYKATDTNGNGFVEKNEFMFFLQFLSYYNNLWDSFSDVDTDGDRRLSKEEFVAGAKSIDMSEDPEDVFDEMDTNGGGLVLFDEFCTWMAAKKYPAPKGAQPEAVAPVVAQKEKEAPKPKRTPRKKIDVPSEEECMKIFSDIDMNGNGLLSLAELDKAVLATWPEFNNKPAIMRAYKATDTNGNGFVEKNEFMFFLQFLSYYNNLWDSFSDVDTDGDRRLSKEEFVAGAKSIDMSEDPEDVFDEMDANGGGLVLFDEFCTWMAAKKYPAPKGAQPEAVAPVVAQKEKEAPKPKRTPRKKIDVPSEEECMDIFAMIDMNGNGLLSLAELDKAVLATWPEFNNKPAIMRAYKATDTNSNGYVEQHEFMFFLQFLSYYNNLWDSFSDFDSDDDRRLSKEEFVAGAAALEEIDNPEKAFDEMDANGGGLVLFDEFCTWMAAKKYPAPKGAERSNTVTAKPKTPPKEQGPRKILTVPSEDECMEIFSMIDMNGNDLLSLAELDKAILATWPEFNNKPAIMRAYKATDTNGNGFVEKKEFLFFLRFLSYYNNMWDSFSSLDSDDDRRLSKEEFVQGASSLGLDDADRVFDQMDENQGGIILFDEFCTYMAIRDLPDEMPKNFVM